MVFVWIRTYRGMNSGTGKKRAPDAEIVLTLFGSSLTTLCQHKALFGLSWIRLRKKRGTSRVIILDHFKSKEGRFGSLGDSAWC